MRLRRGKGPAAPDDDPGSEGWDAVTAAVETLVPGVEPTHVGYTPGVHFGSGLQGCSAYLRGDHWLYVTYGLTELWAKESTTPDISGYGFELTMRVAGGSGAAPQWPFPLLEGIARQVRGGWDVWPGDRLGFGGPITGGKPPSALTTVAFAEDLELAEISTPNGSVAFLTAVGVTADEVERAKATSTEALLAELGMVTDPLR